MYLVDYDANETSASLCGSLDVGSSEYLSCLDDVDTSRIYVDQVATKTLGQQ
jgi:hypothetical protein